MLLLMTLTGIKFISHIIYLMKSIWTASSRTLERMRLCVEHILV